MTTEEKPKKKRGRPPKQNAPDPYSKSLLSYIKTPESVQMLKTIMSLRDVHELWRGKLCVPPGSFMWAVLDEFERKTDIPLEIPFFSVFHILSGYMLNKRIGLLFDPKVEGGSTQKLIYPDIWTILLAPSGSSKSFSFDTIQNLDKESMDESIFSMTGIQSKAAFFYKFYGRRDKNGELKYPPENFKLGRRDEFNEFYKEIKERGGPLGGVKDYMLQMYDNNAIEYELKDDVLKTDNLYVSFYYTTIFESFVNYLNADDIINGVLPRHAIVITQQDESRPIQNYPWYFIDNERLRQGWKDLIGSIKHSQYIAGPEAFQAYCDVFKSLCTSPNALDKSFTRRIAARAHKYALIYHIINNRGEQEKLDATDYGYSANILHMQLSDAKKLLQEYGLPDLEKKIKTVDALIKRYTAQGKPITPRIISQNVRGIKGVTEAKMILDFAREFPAPIEQA